MHHNWRRHFRDEKEWVLKSKEGWRRLREEKDSKKADSKDRDKFLGGNLERRLSKRRKDTSQPERERKRDKRVTREKK